MTGEVPRGSGADDPTEDRTLLARLRAGEDAAFGELFSRHSAAVYRLGLGLVSDRAEAEDLTAEAFFRVLQAIRRGSGPVDNVRAYLLIVARRVAWEWSLRRRDVPVTDEELTHRAPCDPDTSGMFTERNLIRRAFTSLPERWRKVLWKMEVEGQRPAAVAINFGLSPNATAALARRARQGLRAAYLQAHLAADRSATGCRSVLEKLGAYTAGSTSGIEYRRIRAHLAGCPSCATMHAELRDVCSGLRAHASFIALPVALASGGGLGTMLKGLLTTAKVQVGVAVGSAALGILGLTVTIGDDGARSPVDFAGKRGVELQLSEPPPLTSDELRAAEGELTTHASGAPGERSATRHTEDHPIAPTSRDRPARTVVPPPSDGGSVPLSETTFADTFDESVPVVYRSTTVERYTEVDGGVTVVRETTTVVETNTLAQTRTTTATTTYTRPPPPNSSTSPSTSPTTSPAASPSGGQQTARTAEPIVSSTPPDGG